MALEERRSGNTTYLNIDYGKKSIYLYSKEEQDGYEKHVSTKGNVSFRKYIAAISGHVVNMYFKDNNLGGTDVMITLQDGDERYTLPVDISSSVFSSIARLLPNLDISKKIRIAIYESKGSTGKSYVGVSVTYPDILNEEGKAQFVEWGDELPKPTKLRNGKWDFSKTMDEAYGRFEQFISESNFAQYVPNTESSEQEVDKPKSPPKATEAADDEIDDDDLPF